MDTVNKKQVIVGVVLLAILISIPLTVSMLSKQQKANSRAAGSTSLSFTPSTTTTSPLQVNVGAPIDLDLYVNPGSDDVTFVRYQVTFDPSKVQLVSSDPFDLNKAIFTNVEGPVVTSDSLAESVSIGSDPTKVITQPTKIGTLHFTAVGNTSASSGNGTTTISFGTLSEALSSGANAQASEDVLSTTSPAVIAISGTGSVTPSTAPTQNPSTTPSAGPTPTSIILPTITGTALKFTVLLDGVGAAGDNPNPTGNSLSNKNPLHPERTLDVQVYDTNNNVVASSSAPIAYDSSSGTFMGDVGIPSSVPSGEYYIKVQTDRYLRKLVPGIIQLVAGQETPVPSVRLISGDSNDDNVLNVLDYNALLDCGYGEISPLPMSDANSTANSSACQVHTPVQNVDLNDDGIIDSTDYNLFLRELSVQSGD